MNRFLVNISKRLVTNHSFSNSNSYFNQQQYRFYSSINEIVKCGSINKSQLKDLLKDNKKNFILIDVRNPLEVETTGVIDTARHIPLGMLPAALSMSEDEFLDTFNFKKFDIKGSRSESAVAFAKSLGYTNSINYPGSFEDWSKN
eukprot:gene4996-6220_t